MKHVCKWSLLLLGQYLKPHQLEVLPGDLLLGEEAVDQVGGQEQSLWHELHSPHSLSHCREDC